MNNKTKFFLVGRRHWELRLKPNSEAIWSRARVPFSKRHWLQWRGLHNPKTLTRERVLLDKKPLWWTIGLFLLALITPFLSNSLISVVSIFCLYAAINVLWTLIVGTAGIFSLATLAVVGISGYGAAAANVYLGVPWPFMLVLGPMIGLIFGAILVREMGKRAYYDKTPVHYPLLAVAGYLGMSLTWGWGMSSSAGLLQATEGNTLMQMGFVDRIIPATEWVLSLIHISEPTRPY